MLCIEAAVDPRHEIADPQEAAYDGLNTYLVYAITYDTSCVRSKRERLV